MVLLPNILETLNIYIPASNILDLVMLKVNEYSFSSKLIMNFSLSSLIGLLSLIISKVTGWCVFSTNKLNEAGSSTLIIRSVNSLRITGKTIK